jgi:hypothetical protein
LWLASQGFVDGGEQAFYTGHDKAHVAQFAHDSAVAFYLHMSLFEDAGISETMSMALESEMQTVLVSPSARNPIISLVGFH